MYDALWRLKKTQSVIENALKHVIVEKKTICYFQVIAAVNHHRKCRKHLAEVLNIENHNIFLY